MIFKILRSKLILKKGEFKITRVPSTWLWVKIRYFDACISIFTSGEFVVHKVD